MLVGLSELGYISSLKDENTMNSTNHFPLLDWVYESPVKHCCTMWLAKESTLALLQEELCCNQLAPSIVKKPKWLILNMAEDLSKNCLFLFFF